VESCWGGSAFGSGVALNQGDQFFKDPQISFRWRWLADYLIVIGMLAGVIPLNAPWS